VALPHLSHSHDNCGMTPWQKRIRRAEELAEKHAFAAEILSFYVSIAGFQENLHNKLNKTQQTSGEIGDALDGAALSKLASQFESFLSLAETRGPKKLAQVSRELHGRGPDFWTELLRSCWANKTPSDAKDFLAVAFLQPYAEFLRSRSSLHLDHYKYALCPFCNRKAGLGVLRQMGDGGARSLVCSFCLAEWDFRRIVCPGCGQENEKVLPVYASSDFDYIRIDACDSCKTYIKTVDMTKNGLAEPIVDEIAALPLDLWAQEQGYRKAQLNLLGL